MAESTLPQGWTWAGVQGLLAEHADLETSARDHRAIQRLRVIRSAAQLLRLLFAYVLSGWSLRTTVGWAQAAGEASLSDQALNERLRQCGPWLAHLVTSLGAAVAAQDGAGPAEFDGRCVLAVDATTVASPGGKDKTYRRLHTAYDIGRQRFHYTELSDRHVAERLDVGKVEAGEIRIGDRCYGRYRDLMSVRAAGADFLVRLSAKALKLVAADGTPLARAALCRRAVAAGTQDVAVKVLDTGEGAPLEARVIVVPLPPDAAEAARRRMRRKAKKSGYTLSRDALVTASCLMLVTSLPTAAWPAPRVLELYRLRWQAELAFKRMKSLLDLERLRSFNTQSVTAWIHVVLLVALLIELKRPSMKIGAPVSPRPAPGAARSRSGASSTISPAP